MKYILVTIMALSLALNVNAEDTSKYKEINNNIKDLFHYAGVYPPQYKNENEKNNANKLFVDTEKQLIQLKDTNKEDYEIYIRLGDLYQAGHNMNIKESWNKSEYYFKKALSLKPEEGYAYYGIGHLYVTTNIEFAKQAEVYLLKALKFGNDDLKIIVYADLAFAKYYQGNFKEAKEYLLKYLKYRNEPSSNKLLKIINEKLEQK